MVPNDGTICLWDRHFKDKNKNWNNQPRYSIVESRMTTIEQYQYIMAKMLNSKYMA